jgi:hypothetical protein
MLLYFFEGGDEGGDEGGGGKEMKTYYILH